MSYNTNTVEGEKAQNESIFEPDYAGLWGGLYQSQSKPDSMISFEAKPDDKVAGAQFNEAIDAIFPAFEEDIDKDWLSGEDFKKLLYKTALHESYNAHNPSIPYTRQVGGGPARSWWQVEPSTARDIVTQFHDVPSKGGEQGPPERVYQASKAYWGDLAKEHTGYSAEQLSGMDDEALGTLLETNPKVAAAMAAAKYIKAHRAKGV